MASVDYVEPSGVSSSDVLLFGSKWETPNITYSFPTSDSDLTDYSHLLDSAYFSGLSSVQRSIFESALSQWSAVADVTFTETVAPRNADIRAYWYLSPDNITARVLDVPANWPEAGDIQLGYLMGEDVSGPWHAGSYPYFGLLHEIGHALGLKHPHEALNGFPAAPADEDSIELSLMSYRSYRGGSTDGHTIGAGSYPQAPMLNDIAAIQYLYGPNWHTNSGDTVYSFDPGAPVILRTIWDGGGTDTYDLSAYRTNLEIDLAPGAWSDFGVQQAELNWATGRYARANLANAYLHQGDTRSLIENAKGGSGHDAITGNEASNRLIGNAGNDTLDGGTGDDDLIGGADNDTYHVDSLSDRITEDPSDPGIDTVHATISYSLAGRVGVENLILSGSAAVDATGNDDGNRLTGNARDNFLDGGIGADTIIGGTGGDTLDGGIGDDDLAGGSGSDTYYVDSPGDLVTENLSDPGTDIVHAAVSYSLAERNGIEDLVLSSSAAISATGNGGNNRLVGNARDNVLDGGEGVDTMVGGAGNDAYFVDSSEDIVTELPGDTGTDTVFALASYSIASRAGLENITLTGSSAIDAIGNDSHNSLTGNSGSNQLLGAEGNDTLNGGAGNDIMNGGAGDDVFYIESSGDILIDPSGNDTAVTTISYKLTSGVENLVASGSSHISLTGSAARDTITGNTGANRLNGGHGDDKLHGGAGNDRLSGDYGRDTLTGGTGKDIFVFGTKPDKKSNLDRIMDFNVKDDTIWLDNKVFTRLGKGTELKPGKLNKAFLALNKAKDGNDYLIYSKKTGYLSYDADGSGSKYKPVEIALLKKGLALTPGDVLII